MKTLAKNKGILGAVALFVIAMFVYNLFFKTDAISIPSESSAAVIGDDLLALHQKLQSVSLDTGIFSLPGYLRLTDFSLEVPMQPTGRPNPFDVIGRQ